MVLKRLSCFRWIFSELLSPPHLLSTLPSGRMSCFVVKSSEKRPILQFEGTSYFGVRGFRPFLALSRVVSFFRCFWNRPLLKTSFKPRAACCSRMYTLEYFLSAAFLSQLTRTSPGPPPRPHQDQNLLTRTSIRSRADGSH